MHHNLFSVKFNEANTRSFNFDLLSAQSASLRQVTVWRAEFNPAGSRSE